MNTGKKILIMLFAAFACSMTMLADLDLKAGASYYIKYGADKYLTLHVDKGGYSEYAAFTSEGSKFTLTYDADNETYTIASVEYNEYIACDAIGYLAGSATPFNWVINGTNSEMSIALEEPNDFGDLYLTDFGGPSIYGDSQDASWSIEEVQEEGPTELPHFYTPCSVKDISISATKNGSLYDALITFTAPSTMLTDTYDEVPLSLPITKIELARREGDNYESDWVVIKTFEKPAFGEVLSYTDAGLGYGKYNYLMTVFVGSTADWGRLEELVVGELPAEFDIEDFTATLDPANDHKIVLSVKAPSLNSNGEPLAMPLTKIELSKLSGFGEPSIIHTFANPTAGQTYTYTYDVTENGNNDFIAQAFTEAGGNFTISASIYVGQDIPGQPENITASATEGGISISWDAPTIGQNGGDFGPAESLTYTVKRGRSEYDESAVVVVENTSNTTILDTTEFGEESTFVYIVTASNSEGTSFAGVSDQITAGSPATLPFAETFDTPLDTYGNTTTDHGFWTVQSTGGYTDWQTVRDTYIGGTSVNPHSGAGFLSVYYDSFWSLNQENTFTSGRIDFSDATAPTLTFWYYDLANTEAETTLKVRISADGEVFADTNFSVTIGSALQDGWSKATVALTGLAGCAGGRVQFVGTASGIGNIPLAIDDVEISKVGDSTGINAIATTLTTSGHAYDLQGRRLTAPKAGLYIQNGYKVLKK